MAPWEDFSPIFCPYLDIWGLASPTMHGEELKYVTEAYETNWMSTVGINRIIITIQILVDIFFLISYNTKAAMQLTKAFT